MDCSCSRRNFVRMTFGFSAGAALSSKFLLPALAQETVTRKPARQVILLWLAGAPSQLDTFDLKPGTKTGGEFKPIDTAAKGVRICEHLPRLAKQMKNVSLIRTVNSRDPNHDTASYLLHTGYRRMPGTGYPHFGSVVLQELKSREGDLPGCVVLGGFPEPGAGYLPSHTGPLVLDNLSNPTEDLGEPPYVDSSRRSRRLKLLKKFEKDFLSKYGDDQRVESRKRSYDSATKLLTSKQLDAFNIRRESEETRNAYGDTDFGKAVLMARRLIESGVRFVEVQLPGWDTHNDNFSRVKGNLDILDPAFSALLSDLVKKDMLKETLVICMGEFGRTPTINNANGRDHFTRAWSVALAGGGIEGGRVVGETDKQGREILKREVGVGDLYATFYSALGIDWHKNYTGPGKRPIPIIDKGSAVKELF